MCSSQVDLDELATKDVPAIPCTDRLASAVTQSPPQRRILHDRSNRIGKLEWIIANQDVLPIDGMQTFAANRCRDDRFSHRPRIQNLEASAAARPERDDMTGRLAHRRPDVFEVSGQLDAESIAIAALLLAGGPTDPADRDIAELCPYVRQDFVAEEFERVAVWKRGRPADIRDAGTSFAAGPELVRVDAIGHDSDP